MSDLYGTRADLLPRSMVKVARAPEGESRLLTWVGRPGVRLLGRQEHLRYEAASLRLFPQNRDGSIAWTEVPGDLVVHAEDEGMHVIGEFLREDGDLVIMWGSLTIPSVFLRATEAMTRISEILDVDPVLWMYRAGALLERNFFEGTMTVARVLQT
ncbi:hypothetical protein [Micromonospora coerulea]|uniref:hypothetical protein n=1 Tax=Micromonospora coerulea TaxID=47856 RepID=UPI0019088706|nr:hypothetical protein [Micromonospora veneta]